MTKTTAILVLLVAAAGLLAGEATRAEVAEPSAGNFELAEVVVTATKKEKAENVQDVPIAVTAFGSQQLETLNFQNLTSLSYTMPNVAMDSIGTTAATANFSIRGLGINSSIPSIDPTVGIFVDGVYMGINAGVLFDNFDLDGIEVLRGPQGVLFGRNVTGGAVVVRTKAPSDTFGATAHVGVESGPNIITDGTITGPLVKGILDAKLAVYHDDDRGLFRNLADGRRFGANRETIVRPVFRWTPTDTLEFILRYEHGQADGDGPAAQNHGLYSRDSFDFSIDQPGHSDSTWEQAFLEANWNVDFGHGKVTNIFGWRKYDSWSTGDIDANSLDLTGADGVTIPTFGAQFKTRQNQRSEELRYAGTFGPADVTTGLYYFQQNLLYLEERDLVSALLGLPPPFFPVILSGGGNGDFSTEGAFAATDWSLTDAWKLNLGVRYTHERKKAAIATEVPGGASIANSTLVPNFDDTHTWSDVSPRVGVQWVPARHSQVYAFWAKGFRSGGYNFRSTAPVPPGPFDAETQSSLEIGWKQDLADGRVRVNLAAFHNKVKNLQREINVPSGTTGVTQVIRNVGDATIQGGELEGIFRATQNLTLSVDAGYTHGKYDSFTADLDGDGVIDSKDFALQLPRLSPWTWGGSAMYDAHLGPAGTLSTRVSFSHRDKAYYTDNNQGYLNKVDKLDANFTWFPSKGPFTFSIYGTNLLNKVTYGGDTILPNVPIFGGVGHGLPTFSPLNKGRVYGAEARVKF
jgi:iron complex outermembrane recepter protein